MPEERNSKNSVSTEEISQFIDKCIERYTKALNDSNYKILSSDGGSDITDSVRGKLSAYIEVKYFLTRGKQG